MALHKFHNNFTGGEWTPLLDGRSDLEKYDSACRTLENMRPLPYGGATMRAGTKFIALAKNANLPTRLIAFNFSTGTRFVLELGESYIRFYSNGVRVETSPGVAYELASPWLSDAVFVLQFKQINDVMYLVHPSYAPRKLSRITDTNWTLAEVSWTYPPMREENITATTLAISNGAIGTGRTLTASAAYFNANMVGGYFEVRHLRSGDAVELAINATAGNVTSSALTIKGDWNVVTTERWYGVLLVERSLDAGATWKTVRKFKSSSDRNVSASGSEVEECQLRLNYTATGDPYGAGPWVGAAPTAYVKATAKLESAEAYATGLVKVTGFTTSVSLTVDVLQTISATTATEYWSEGAWSPYRGYPAAVGLFEQRLLFGATAERPTFFWGSVTGDFENFAFSEEDDAAIAFGIATAESNPIKWIESLQRIQLGTGGGEYSASAGSQDEPLTPSNVSVRGQSSYGSGSFQPVLANDSVLFMQRQGTRLREMAYDFARDAYVAPDLTLLAEHVTSGGVIQLGFARQPDSLVFAVTGVHLAVLTYNREQNITAWARYVTARTRSTDIGGFESACAIYGTPKDEVWCVVRRVVNGSQVRTVERFAEESEVKADARLLDGFIQGTLTDPFSGSISGLSHLESESVRLVVAGAVIGDYTVSGGAITVPVASVTAFGSYCVGLPYSAKVQPMKLDVVMANGPSQGRMRRVSSITIRFHKSLGCKFGPDDSHLEEVTFRDAGDAMDASAPLFTGDKTLAFPGTNAKEANVLIVQDLPLPFTLIGLAIKAEVFGD